MKVASFAAICLCCFLGSGMGAFFALRPSVVAHAQLQPLRSQPGITQPRMDDKLTIPNDGLPIVNSRNQVLGRFQMTGEGLSLVLLNRNGQPGVTLEAGLAGTVALGAAGEQAGFTVQNSQGSKASALILRDQATLTATASGKEMKAKIGSSSSFAFPGRGKSPFFEITDLPDGGTLSLNSREGKPLASFVTSLDWATLQLDSPKARTKFSADSRGSLTITKAGAKVWGSPASESLADAPTDPPGSVPPKQR
jgi:hypothetical protein